MRPFCLSRARVAQAAAIVSSRELNRCMLRETARDPDVVSARPPKLVERYEQ